MSNSIVSTEHSSAFFSCSTIYYSFVLVRMEGRKESSSLVPFLILFICNGELFYLHLWFRIVLQDEDKRCEKTITDNRGRFRNDFLPPFERTIHLNENSFLLSKRPFITVPPQLMQKRWRKQTNPILHSLHPSLLQKAPLESSHDCSCYSPFRCCSCVFRMKNSFSWNWRVQRQFPTFCILNKFLGTSRPFLSATSHAMPRKERMRGMQKLWLQFSVQEQSFCHLSSVLTNNFFEI